jgi:hypothetical protein
MDFRDILGKFNETKQVINESIETPAKENSLPSLKKIFESLSEAVPAGMKPLAILDPANKQAGAGVVTSKNPAVQKMLGSLDPKDVQIVMTTQQQKTGTQPAPTPTTQATAMKEEQVDEKWAGDAKIKPTGQYSGKSKEELKSMLAKLKKSGPHGKDSPAAKKMRQINFALRAKGGWKSGEGAAMKEEKVDEKFASKQQAKLMYAVAGDKDVAKKTGVSQKVAKEFIKKSHGQKVSKLPKKVSEAEIASTKSQDTMGAGLGAGRNPNVLEGSKPDFLDLDKDGNKKESMKKAAADKKKKVKESMNPKIKAAYHEGYSHGLRGESHSGKRYEDMEEARQYHEGYKCGLDECYGMSGDAKMGDRQAPIVGLVGEGMPESTEAMAHQGLPNYMPEAEMDEGNAFTAALAKTPKGGKFTVGGKSFTDNSNYDSKIDEFAFESLDKQLNALLNETIEQVNEGISVSMSTGNEGSPDTVSVTATDEASSKLLDFIKQVGLGGMGADKPEMSHGEPAIAVASDYGAPKFSGHDGMAALLKKVGADGDEHDHAPEAKHGDMCSECGMGYTAEGSCGCDKESVEEVQTPDQTLYATTSEGTMKETDGEGDIAAYGQEAEINSSMPAKGGATNEDGAEAPGSDVVGQSEQEAAEEVNEESEAEKDDHAERAAKKVAKDIEYDEGHKGKDDDKAERAGEKVKKDIEYDDKKDHKMSESSFFDLYKKISLLSEESTAEKDDKAERAAKKVAKDIEYDEGHKGKDDNKAEKAGKEVKKDIEYDDKKDKKLDEWANQAGQKGTDTAFEQDIEFMTKVISGGLNKPKATGQTTIPVIAHQDARTGEEDVKAWKKLAGLDK